MTKTFVWINEGSEEFRNYLSDLYKKIGALALEINHLRLKSNCNNCIHCGKQLSYSEKYDSYYCKKCNYWDEVICPDKKCEFCSKRPKYPNKK